MEDTTNKDDKNSLDENEAQKCGSCNCEDSSSDDSSDLDKIEELENEIEELKIKINDYDEKYMRAFAESENIRKRAEKERRDIIKNANKTLLAKLLGFMDNFERAINSVSKDEEMLNDDFYKGIELIAKDFNNFLEEAGVKEFNALGEAFNPNIHEALTVAEVEDETKADTVVEVFIKGYTLNDELLRSAKVVIGKAKQS